MTIFIAVILFMVATLVFIFIACTANDVIVKEQFHTAPAGVINHNAAPPNGSNNSLSKINYHSGSLMNNPNIYIVWYGNWSAGAKNIIKTFIRDISGSSYMNINSTYAVNGKPVGKNLNLSGEYLISGYPQGKNLSDTQILNLIKGVNPTDTNGIYFLLTSEEISTVSGFCRSYCGWHSYANVSNRNIKYSFVGNPKNCLNSCAIQNLGPNGTGYEGVDAMLSIIAHEINETITDPNFNGWYDSQGNENADKCAWTYGSTTSQIINGKTVYNNLTLNGRKYLLQRNFNQKTSTCTMSY